MQETQDTSNTIDDPGGQSLQNIDRRQWMQWWTREINRVYTGSEVRWARIVGRRWEFLDGHSPDITYSTVRLAINNRLGLCVSNAGFISQGEQAALKDSISQSRQRLDERQVL